MFIVLHCGGIAFNGETIHKRSLGGSETAAYHLARELAALGHRIRLFTKSREEGEWDGVRYCWIGEEGEAAPLGNHFEAYAMNTPHDVLIVQRHPLGLQKKYACKQAYFWLHDLALGRNKPAYDTGLWQANGLFVVSEFHKEQVSKALGVVPSAFLPITNGVDPKRFEKANASDGDTLRWKLREEQGKLIGEEPRLNEFAMLYTSRPERGLEHLVRPGGIAERLEKEAPNAHIYVCAYEHDVPEMKPYYAQLQAWAGQRKNCTLLGHLTQAQLADVMASVQLHIYPTEFEEVSCITAMECMHAGLPMLVSRCAAIPETCKGAGVILVDLKDGRADEDLFVKHAARLAKNGIAGVEYQQLKERQLKVAPRYDWKVTAKQVLSHVESAFAEARQNVPAMLRHMLRFSDYQGAKHLLAKLGDRIERWKQNPVFARCLQELELYRFAESPEAYREHYERETSVFYDRDYKPETVASTPRFELVCDWVAAALGRRSTRGDAADARLVLLDMGCAHGHYSLDLARRFPQVHVVGADLSERAIIEARKMAADAKLSNVEFHHLTSTDFAAARAAIPALSKGADLVLIAEVLEHMLDPWLFFDGVMEGFAAEEADVIFTTPIGPWELMSYRRTHPVRFHVQHLERMDLDDMFKGFELYDLNITPNCTVISGEYIGNYVGGFVWKKGQKAGAIDFDRKLAMQAPRQTVALCMIVKDGELILRRTLEPAADLADHLVIGIDRNTKDDTEGEIKRFEEKHPLWPVVTVQRLHSALEEGFDVARNATIDEAGTDWALWLDADEELVRGMALARYLRPNGFNGYALQQHHFAVEPLGVLMTDLPARLFRLGIGIKFLGCVHEHPEMGENEGVGAAMLLGEVHIAHHGYYTEEIRRGRFQRNFELMTRDRKTNPTRKLGRALWVRDLSHMISFTLEQTRGMMTGPMRGWALELIQHFEEMLKDGDIRLIKDSLAYYSNAVRILGGGVEVALRMDAQRVVEASTHRQPEIKALFANRQHAERVASLLLDANMKPFDSKYW